MFIIVGVLLVLVCNSDSDVGLTKLLIFLLEFGWKLFDNVPCDELGLLTYITLLWFRFLIEFQKFVVNHWIDFPYTWKTFFYYMWIDTSQFVCSS